MSKETLYQKEAKCGTYRGISLTRNTHLSHGCTLGPWVNGFCTVLRGGASHKRLPLYIGNARAVCTVPGRHNPVRRVAGATLLSAQQAASFAYATSALPATKVRTLS